jgi:short-subunit dehydrogenase
MIDFAGKLILVTGASSGLGQAIALRLATVESADVIVAARRTDRLEQLVREIGDRSDARAYAVTVDLAERDGPRVLAEQVREIEAGRRLAADTSEPTSGLARSSDGSATAGSCPRLFGLVNNAGVTSYGAFAEAERAALDRVVTVNLRAPIALIRLLLPGMIERGEGAILNVTSLAAYLPVPYQSVYCATKNGLQAFTESLAMELRGSGVRVAAFAPGGIATEWIAKWGLDARFNLKSGFLESAEIIAREAIRFWKSGRLRGLGGRGARLGGLLGRLLPPPLTGRAAARMYRPPAD